ncbi:FAD-dependent oxidoreductase [Pyxidicoccus fallax]|uniref:FAD-dependent oxidoreductase n=1 Tax=Pyxidicoccus fallax TaxID=394095 RepID=A0A848LEX9_9BACT|nr:NAD(P)/FAD-dependent oxidoreductase [Pyxidicoccus fallax]NMO16974.1 FAD-dependent oxidoreductase [Pyxidicoccus fallax]NPC79007.1 FAD-dependent oxidoreductase [Pyxidicoccus fallax]
MTLKLNRRAFLQWLGVAGAGLGLPACVHGRGGGDRRVIVAGAGLAGLTAAYELVKLGYDVTVLEAQAQVGGRVRTHRRGFTSGQYAELGAVRIPDVHQHTLGYVKEFGLPLVEFTQGEPLYYLKGQRFTHRDGQPWPLELTPREQERGLGMAAEYIAAHFEEFGDPRRGTFPTPAALARYDALTFARYLHEQGASEDWLRLYMAENGTEPPVTGTLAWMAYEAADREWQRTFHIRGGNDQLPRALARRLGERVRLEHAVVRIEQDSRNVRVWYQHGGRTESLQAAHLVCAIPPSLLREVELRPAFSEEKMRLLRELVMAPSSRMWMQTRTRFWSAEGLGGLKLVKTDTPVERLWDLSSVLDGPQGMMMAYMDDQNARAFAAVPATERPEYVLRHVERFFPTIRSEVLAFQGMAWSEDPWVRGAWPNFQPGQGWMLPVLPRPEGRVHFAGEHTSLWTGWMQGAIESGKRVVREITGA